MRDFGIRSHKSRGDASKEVIRRIADDRAAGKHDAEQGLQMQLNRSWHARRAFPLQSLFALALLFRQSVRHGLLLLKMTWVGLTRIKMGFERDFRVVQRQPQP
jgi:hypothetical protein